MPGSLSTLSLTAALLWAVPIASFAQPSAGTQPAQPNASGWQTEVGVGVIVNPEFQGSEDYRSLAVPYVDVKYVDEQGVRFFANVPQGIGAWLLRRRDASTGHTLKIGAALAPGFANRDEQDLPGLDDFGPALEARAYLNYSAGRFGLQAALSQAVASGHRGFYADLSASLGGRLGGRGFWSVGPTLRIGNATYNNALYGISAPQSIASNLPAFDPGSGLESIALQGLISVPVSDKWRWTGLLRGGQLAGDRGDSPVVADQTQWFALTALTRLF